MYLQTSHKSSPWAVLAVLTLPVLFSVQCQMAQPRVSADADVLSSIVVATPAAPPAATAGAGAALADLAGRDPLAFLKHCRAEYDRRVQDYRCRFVKQEAIGSVLTDEQEMVVNYRETPTSIDMAWTRNPGQALRAVWVRGKWLDDSGAEMAWVKPAGAILKLLIPKIQQPIHGPRAQAASRRTIDEFGFRRTLDLIIEYCEKGQADGVLDLKLIGESNVDGRPTFLFERRLPFTEEYGPFPDRLLRFHIDQEWLVPTACYSYADDQSKMLLGKYLLTDVSFNNGFTDRDFDPQTLGF